MLAPPSCARCRRARVARPRHWRQPDGVHHVSSLLLTVPLLFRRAAFQFFHCACKHAGHGRAGGTVGASMLRAGMPGHACSRARLNCDGWCCPFLQTALFAALATDTHTCRQSPDRTGATPSICHAIFPHCHDTAVSAASAWLLAARFVQPPAKALTDQFAHTCPNVTVRLFSQKGVLLRCPPANRSAFGGFRFAKMVGTLRLRSPCSGFRTVHCMGAPTQVDWVF